MTDEQREVLRQTAEQRLQRLRYLASAIEDGPGLTVREYMEVAAVLRQLIEDAEGKK